LPRKFGQHFLRDQSILARIAAAVCPEGETPHVVEIGPGRGALTRCLLPLAAKLTAIEVDPAMVAHLAQFFGAEEKLEVIHQDVLQVDLTRFAPCVIAGNLPYYISSPIASKVFDAAGVWRRAVFLVQKEVAVRMAAPHGSRDYGYLSVMTQVFSEPRILFEVPPGAFSPPPKVNSAVIQLEPKVVDRAEADRFLKFASRAFAQKRKTLRNNLASYYGKELIEAQPEANLRAEQLSPAQLRDLEQRLSNTPPMLS
jgi:16S rRNA (adenine1518-N6/adenine1519-N6)-dimethyltransferase